MPQAILCRERPLAARRGIEGRRSETMPEWEALRVAAFPSALGWMAIVERCGDWRGSVEQSTVESDTIERVTAQHREMLLELTFGHASPAEALRALATPSLPLDHVREEGQL